ncbi:hypothetical protein C0989_006704 [Termitomyces sp. Mn162]|nr:hypothetical protein C0989_006704 [Termitomyces sp. Mn162]
MVMSAYCAVFLLKLLRSSAIYSQLNENTAKDIYDLISATAEAYHNASLIAPESSAATHARFLRSLVSNDVFVRRNDPKHEMAIDPQLEREILECFAFSTQFSSTFSFATIYSSARSNVLRTGAPYQ